MFEIDMREVIASSERVQKQLMRVPPIMRADCEMAVANYMLNVLVKQEVPPEKRIKRVSVYGKPFQSEKQRRWFFWALKHSIIDVPYRRRGKHGGISTQWHIIQRKDAGVILQNHDPAAKYVYGDTTQNKLIGAIGWKTITAIVTERVKALSGVLKRAADNALKKAIPKA